MGGAQGRSRGGAIEPANQQGQAASLGLKTQRPTQQHLANSSHRTQNIVRHDFPGGGLWPLEQSITRTLHPAQARPLP